MASLSLRLIDQACGYPESVDAYVICAAAAQLVSRLRERCAIVLTSAIQPMILVMSREALGF
jgi:hypothetical protein